ncbi:MAG: glycosyltransferase family 2 protein [Planctomycetota bacterium]
MTSADLVKSGSTVGVVIPSYKVRNHILAVIEKIGPEVHRIYVVDDCCPDGSGDFVEQNCRDPRVKVLRNAQNQGVGGAVASGYREGLAEGIDVLVKIDGDGQMDPALIPQLVAPIQAREADYAKGNRFFDLKGVRSMPKMRVFGNAALSFLTKLSSGYWDLFDPTNGYTAIHRTVLARMPLDKVSRGYFFETDMLFRLNTLRAVVVDVPMDANYGDEVSNLTISKIIGEFFFKHIRNFSKRVFYNYYLRDMSIASIELPLGLLMIAFGSVFGGYHWIVSWRNATATPSGTVMLAAMPILIGIHFVLAFLAYDIHSVPRRPLHRR